MLLVDIIVSLILVIMWLVVSTQDKSTYIFDSEFIVLVYVLFVTTILVGGRSPFDLSEAESELVSGGNTEFTGIAFSLVYIVEVVEVLIGLYMLCYILVTVSSIGYQILYLLILMTFNGRLILVRYPSKNIIVMFILELALIPIIYVLVL